MFSEGNTSVLVVDPFFIPLNMKDVPKAVFMECYISTNGNSLYWNRKGDPM